MKSPLRINSNGKVGYLSLSPIVGELVTRIDSSSHVSETFVWDGGQWHQIA